MKRNTLFALAVFIAGLLVAGCTSLPKAADMSPAKIELQHRSDKPVKVVVVGEPKVENNVQIENAELAGAIQMAIENVRLFSKTGSAVDEGFLLEVTIVGYDPPGNGFNLSASMTTRWKLSRIPGDETVFEDFFKKTHTSTVGDAFNADTRRRKANEGVMRDTIAEGLKRISASNL